PPRRAAPRGGRRFVRAGSKNGGAAPGDHTLADRASPDAASSRYSGSQWALPLESIGSPRLLMKSKEKKVLKSVVRLAMNPLLNCSAGPASEKWSVIMPVKVFGSATVFDTRNALL